MNYELLIFVGSYNHAPAFDLRSQSPFMAVSVGQMIDIAGHPPAPIQQIHHVFLGPPAVGVPLHQIKILI